METVNAPTFRLRRGGRISGPFSRTHIRLMARRGEVLLTDELSLNGGQWLPVIRTPLAQEVTRKPSITLSSPSSSSAGHAGDTAVAPVIPFPKPRPAAKPKAAPQPAPRPAPVRQEAPPPPPQTDDPLAGWETGEPSYASRHRPRRRRPAKRSGGGLEVFFLVALAVVALGIIAFVVFRFNRGDGTASAPTATKPPASGPVAPAAADWKAFAGRIYGLWESQNATGPALRFHLLADGRVETLGNAPVDIPSAVDRWAVAGGELTLVNDKGMATYRFPAQADQRELTGTFYGKKWRKLVLEGR